MLNPLMPKGVEHYDKLIQVRSDFTYVEPSDAERR